jgi:hypothetical protein
LPAAGASPAVATAPATETPPATVIPAGALAPSAASPTGAPSASAETPTPPTLPQTAPAATVLAEAATATPPPLASETEPSQTITPSATPTTPPTQTSPANPVQATATPSPTATATLAPTLAPLAIRNDQACTDAAGRLYIYGELVNTAALPYQAALDLQVFGAGGALTVTDSLFDMPGRFVVPPGRTLPFVISARLSEPAFTRYALTPRAEASVSAGAGPVRLDDFTATDGEDLVTIAGRWTNTGTTPLSEYVDVYAAVYDAQGRLTNLLYETITAQVNLTPGQHTFQLFLDPAQPCGAGNVQVGVIGE